MRCLYCQTSDTQVIDSRDSGTDVRRRRECLTCKRRFTTYERIEKPTLTVLKKNGDSQHFDAEKIRRGVAIACKNRPLPSLAIDQLVQQVEEQLYELGRDTVTSVEIGQLVRERLEQLDKVAYLRFTSVCQSFTSVEEFTHEITHIQ